MNHIKARAYACLDVMDVARVAKAGERHNISGCYYYTVIST